MSEENTMRAVAEKKGEAVLHVKVYRKDGTVEEHEGTPVEIPVSAQLEAAIKEYQAIVARAKALEQVITELLTQRKEP